MKAAQPSGRGAWLGAQGQLWRSLLSADWELGISLRATRGTAGPGAAATHMPQTGRPGSPSSTPLYPAVLVFASFWPQHPPLAVRAQTGWGGARPADFCVRSIHGKEVGHGARVGVGGREGPVLRSPGVGLRPVNPPFLP